MAIWEISFIFLFNFERKLYNGFILYLRPFGRLWGDETVPTVVTRAEPHNQVIFVSIFDTMSLVYDIWILMFSVITVVTDYLYLLDNYSS